MKQKINFGIGRVKKGESGESEMLKFINANPALVSLLYDLGMLPEQCPDKGIKKRLFNCKLQGLVLGWMAGASENK